MANKNIEIRQMNSSGNYDYLYPKTLGANVTIDSSTAKALGLSDTATVNQALSALQSTKAPLYSYSLEDLVAGSSSLTTGKLYFVYE